MLESRPVVDNGKRVADPDCRFASLAVNGNGVRVVVRFVSLAVNGNGVRVVVRFVEQQSVPVCPSAPAQHHVLAFGSQRVTVVLPRN